MDKKRKTATRYKMGAHKKHSGVCKHQMTLNYSYKLSSRSFSSCVQQAGMDPKG